MSARVSLAAVVLLIALWPVSAQTPPSPAAAGKSSVRGRILAADTGKPLRRAVVTLSSPDLRGPARTANTGLDGVYEFTELPAGRYTLTVRRSGYLSLRHGQTRPLEPDRPLQLGDGQRLDNIDFSLPRMGTITGRVLDDAGEPMANAIVWAMRPVYLEGRRQLAVATGGFEGTDDTGTYRLTGLSPGRYYIRAFTRETWTVAGPAGRQVMGFSPTFFPGTTLASEAVLVELGVGQHVRNADFLLQAARTAAISGVALDSSGRPLAGRNAGLTIRLINAAAAAGGGGMSAGSAPIAADGTFTFTNVFPGEYEVSVSTGNVRTGDGETARTSVLIDGADIDNVRLVTSAGWSVAGRIVTDEGTVPDFTPQTMRVGSQLTGDARAASGSVGEVNGDWTFSIRAILGSARLTADVPAGWMVKQIRHNDRDLAEYPVELRSGERLDGVEIVISQRVSRVTGKITDDRGAPVESGTVIVFADEAARWGVASRYVAAARPDQQGAYEIAGLPAGEYQAVAIDYVQDGMWNDPEYLELLRRYAQRFTLADGGSQALTLRVVMP